MKTIPLGSLAKLVMGQAPPGTDCNHDKLGIPFVKAGEFGENRPVIREWTTNPLKLAKETDVLICVVGATAGKLNLGAECAIGRSVAAIRPGDRLDQMFLYHLLRGKVSELRKGSQGSAQGVITSPMLAEIAVPDIPLSEQKRIAGILDAADRLRQQDKALIGCYNQLAQSVFLEMFGDPVRNERGWKETTLGKIIEDGPKNGLYKPSSDYGSGTPIVRIDSFHNSLVDLGKLKRVAISASENDQFQLLEGDLVINRVNSRSHLGKCGLIPALTEPTVFESNMMRIRLDRTKANPNMMLWLLTSKAVKNQILNCCKDAVNQSSINQKDVESFRIPLPPLPLQQKFAEVIENIEHQKAQAEASGKESEGLFQSLLQSAFKGEL